MRVFKFGGASLESEERIRQVALIVKAYLDEPLVVIVSAMGKTTNQLEKIVEHYYRRHRETAAELLSNLITQHQRMASAVIGEAADPVFSQLQELFHEMEWKLGEKPYKSYDFYYDQLVSRGELLSSLIVSAYFRREGIPTCWLDARGVIRTDDTFRDGRVAWNETLEAMTREARPLLSSGGVVMSQGFIGSTADGFSTTLGREGSDYTAALFANMLDARSLSIWKDVEGLKNADPKLFSDTIPIEEINYNEVIEMAYYGAQVIHPKTIKPLQNKKIPLLVKCFQDMTLPGTIIHQKEGAPALPPIIVLKKKQVLITLSSRDFSFITEENLSRLYNTFHALKIKINLMQNGAISFSCCMDQSAEKIERLIKTLNRDFQITYHEGLELLTVRHYAAGVVDRLTEGKTILLEQKSPKTIQMVLKGA